MAKKNHRPHRGYLKPPGLCLPCDECSLISEHARKHELRRFVVPAKSGRAWTLAKGECCRFLLNEGPQVGDVNIWQAHNTKEHFYSGKTRQLHQAHLSVGDRLWSNLPYLRPLATIIADTLKDRLGTRPDADGMRVHDVLGTRCDPYIQQLITGEQCTTSCHQILTEAIKPFHLQESDVHDVFNIFMCTGLDPETHEYLIKGTPAIRGDFIEILAETDLLVALSACPAGDVSLAVGEPVPDCLCHSIEVVIGQGRTNPNLPNI